MSKEYYPQAMNQMIGNAGTGVALPIPMVAQLKQQFEYHAAQSRRITDLLDLLEKNPDFEKFINLSRGLI